MDLNCPGCRKFEFELSPEKIAALAAQIPISSDQRADEGILDKRLAACSACEAVREGVLCAFCGCFILFRARVCKAYCPHPNGDKWE